MWSTHVAILVTLLLLYNPVSGQDNISCLNPYGRQGNCQNIRTCEPLLKILSEYGNRAGDFLRRSVCGHEGKDPRVCCPFDENGNRSNDNDNTNSGEQWNSQYGPILPPQCGTTDAKYTRVVGGVPAKLGTWPWIAALGYRRQNSNKPNWLCAGSLISTRHVLTAAHCVYDQKNLYLVRLGDLDLESNDDGATPIDLLIERKTIHPQYNPTNYTNDIAILRLERDVQFTPLVKPICLPVTENIKRKNLVATFPFLVGWGSLHFNGPRTSKLQQLQIPVVSPNKCKEAFKDIKSATIDDRVLCAGYSRGGKDACQGDSGGPLMYPLQGSFYAVGIISYGYKCAEPGFPGVYTKTTLFLDFIMSELN